MPLAPSIPVIDDAVKLRFAEAYLRTQNASTAAMQVIGDPGMALKQSYLLMNDPFVIDAIDALKDEKGEQSFLPTKFTTAREILDRAKLCSDSEGYERLMKLYCSIMGYVERPGANVNVAVAVSNVMTVTDHGSDDEWEAKAIEQQRKLTLDASI